MIDGSDVRETIVRTTGAVARSWRILPCERWLAYTRHLLAGNAPQALAGAHQLPPSARQTLPSSSGAHRGSLVLSGRIFGSYQSACT